MEPFLGEIKIFAGNFAPTGWAFCDGSLLNIRSNTALFALLGITYGGDGRNTFGLPNLQGSAPMHFGQGTGLTNRNLGETGGENSVTLQTAQLAQHTHSLNAVGRQTADTNTPTSSVALSGTSTNSELYLRPAANVVQMSPSGTGPNGGGQPHNNLQPYLALSFIIALEGVFPPRS